MHSLRSVSVKTKSRWKRPQPHASPHVWYELRAEDARLLPVFRVGRAARALGPEDSQGCLWLLDPRGVAWHVPAASFSRKQAGTRAPGGIRLVSGSRIVSAFLIDGAWQLAARGRIWPGPVMVDGERFATTLERLHFWIEEHGVV